MTRTNYFLITALLTLTLTGTSILAERGPGSGNASGGPVVAGQNGDDSVPGGRRDDRRRGFAGILPSRIILVRILQLTEEQLAEVEALIEEIKNTLGPIHEEIAMLAEDLKAELGMEPPDPLVVGEIVIAIHDLRGEIASLSQGFREDFLSILTDAQLQRLQEFIDSHHRDEGDGG